MINGKEVSYDVCHDQKSTASYDSKIFKYIGKGTIHTIDGVKQGGSGDLDHFWIKRKHKSITRNNAKNIKTKKGNN